MASNNRSDGDGSIYYDKARDRYVGSLVVGWRDGKPIRKKVSANSRTGAASKLRKLRDDIENKRLPVGTTPSVEKWMRYWLDEIAANKVRGTTLAGYRSKVDRYIIPLLGSRRIDRLTPEDIESAYRHLLEVGCPEIDEPKPLSTTSVHQTHRILARALKVAHQRGHVTRNVATLIDAPQPEDKEIVPFDEKDARKILAAAAELDRNGARWTVALALGLRQGEALGLTWSHVDLDKGTIKVWKSLTREDGAARGKGYQLGPVKSRAGKRVIHLPKQLIQALRKHRLEQNSERMAAGSKWDAGIAEEYDGLVFPNRWGGPCSASSDWLAWKNLLKAAKVEDKRLHDARHTAATMLLTMGVPLRTAQEILGHSRITQTQRYTHVLDAMHEDAAEKMSAFWG